MKRRTVTFLGVFLLKATAPCQDDQEHVVITFRKVVLTTEFHAEACGIGDFDGDGHVDAYYGAQWYAGPDFKQAHPIFPVETFDPKAYSNNFFTAVHDLDGDGWDDVMVHEWPGKAVHWFQNPGKDGGAWKRHLAHPYVDNESPGFGDVTGDGHPELLFTHAGRLGYAAPGSDPTIPWRFVPISDKGSWQRYSHGLGYGDVSGDGKPDFLMADGWWEQVPETSNTAPEPKAWKAHAFAFGPGGAQMHVYDVDGDGDGDVITSLVAHGYGLAWFERSMQGDEVQFTRHLIVGEKPEDNPYGVRFSQLHAVCLADIDGDGLSDIVTGKRYWAHGPTGDVEPNAPAVLYWFQLVRTDEGVHYVPHLIDDDSGVGTQFCVGDVNGDGFEDIVVGNKKGGYVFLQQRSKVSRAEWEKTQPKRSGDK